MSRNINNEIIFQACFYCVKMSEKPKKWEEGCGDTTDVLKKETLSVALRNVVFI